MSVIRSMSSNLQATFVDNYGLMLPCADAFRYASFTAKKAAACTGAPLRQPIDQVSRAMRRKFSSMSS